MIVNLSMSPSWSEIKLMADVSVIPIFDTTIILNFLEISKRFSISRLYYDAQRHEVYQR